MAMPAERKDRLRKLRLGLPGTGKPEGPKIFLSRLKESVERQGIARTTHFLNPLHDVSLFVSVARDYIRKPYVLRLDGIYIDARDTCGPNEQLNAPIKQAIGGAKGLIYQSAYNKRIIEYHLGASDIPSVVIPNGANLQQFSPEGASCRERLGIPADARVLLTSGTWRAHKRLGAVIELFRGLRQHHSDLHLIIIGSAEELRVADKRIHCVGFIEPRELAAWYRSADLYVFLAWLDNCPNSVVEAIATGLPVLCTNLGGTRELVERADAGIVAEADQPVGPEFVDLYQPPQPDMQVLLNAAEAMLEGLPSYRSRLNRAALDIDAISRAYIEHIAACAGMNRGKHS